MTTITRIGIRLGANPVRALGDTPLGSEYLTRWWLPVLGPSATWLLHHIARDADSYRDTWRYHTPTELAAPVGLGTNGGINGPLIRSLDRINRFRCGRWVLTPRDSQGEPLLTIYDTVNLVPEPIARSWPDPMRKAHAAHLASIARVAGLAR